MDKKQIIIIVVLLVILLLVGIFGYQAINDATSNMSMYGV